MLPIKTRLTKLLNIATPILSAPMGYGWSADLATAVSTAGGFGWTGAAFDTSEQLRERLRGIRAKLNVPAGQPLPVGIGLIGWVLDKTEISHDRRIPTVLDELPTAIWFAFGKDLGQYVRQVREYERNRAHKTLVFVCVNSVEEAVIAKDEWHVDVICAQGIEAGGHGGSNAPSTGILLTAILDALGNTRPLIVAAGGIATGAQIASMLTLGADGAVLGTRMLFTHECGYTPAQKSWIQEAALGDTKRGMCFDEVNRTMGWPEGIDGHAIANDIWTDYQEGLSLEERLKNFDDSKAAGENRRVVVWAGSGVGLTRQFQPAAEVIRELHNDTVKHLKLAASLL